MGRLRYSRSHFETIESGTFEVSLATSPRAYGSTKLVRALSRGPLFLSTLSTVVVQDADLLRSLHAEVFAQESMLTSGMAFSAIWDVPPVSSCQSLLSMLSVQEVLSVNFSRVVIFMTSLLEPTPLVRP